jgi:cytidylate kinase
MPDHTKDSFPSRIEQRLNAQLALASRIKHRPVPAAVAPAPFVTISREYGCEAMALAEMLAPQLAALEKSDEESWPIYNRQLLEGISETSHLSKRVAEALDVRSRSGIEEFFQTLIGQSPPDIEVLHHLIRCERALALLGHCIIVGRGGALLTAGLKGGIHIRLVASEEWRLNNLVARFSWDAAKARSILREEEQSRNSFYLKYLGQDMNKPENFDLTLNAARIPREQQVEMILTFFRLRYAENGFAGN